ncbi:hypothetical protein HPULCUR_003227 [Helicostylum pulchrum]|uniref:Nudix hydrolase domain-containing protein n=1 Tax=Helicostylum pulchrum TaxID=562976 RepID=A0ABP9XSY7_9FUNG
MATVTLENTAAIIDPVNVPGSDVVADEDVRKEKKEKKEKKDKKEKKTKKSKKDKEEKEAKPIRQAVGVIVIDPATQKVLMLSSRKKEGAYVLPRDDCQTEPTEEHPEKAAIRLLHEKAGVAATFLSSRVGSYAESNKKGKVIAHHWMYEVNAPTLLETWPDATRQRVWVNFISREKKRVKH